MIVPAKPRPFDFPTDPADGIAGVTVKELRLMDLGDAKERITLESMSGADRTIWQMAEHRIGLDIGGADEASGVVHLAHVDGIGVDAVALEPRPVVVEVDSHRVDEDGPQAQTAEAEGDIGRHSTASDFQRLDEERQRDPVELVGDERVGKATREGHEVIGRDRPRHDEGHAKDPIGRRAARSPDQAEALIRASW